MAGHDSTSDPDYVDAHFHIWDLSKFSYPWPTDKEEEIYRSFGPEDMKNAMQGTRVRHAVFVQVLNDCTEEALWLCQEADKHSFIKGVVAGVDVTSDNLHATLNTLARDPRVVGVRHILDLEPDKEWLTREATLKGLEVLQERGLTFDLLLRPPLVQYIPELSRRLPRLKMVVDHLAKPYIKDGLIEKWADEMTALAQNPNIYCKLSGMVTEADLKAWKEEDFEPYVKHVLACFGPERCMFGSDWPVCGLAGAAYSDVYNLMLRLIRKWSPGNETAIFRDNAVRFYGLKI